MSSLKLCIITIIIWVSASIKGIDFSQKQSYESLLCAAKLGYTFAIVRGARSNGGVDSAARVNIQAAYRAGLKTDIYIYPCPGYNATVQVYNMMNSLPKQASSIIDTVWIDIETSNSVSESCSWESYTPETNCDFIKETASAIESKGKKVGIYTNKVNWIAVFGDQKECSSLSKYPLWYARYDNLENFQDFVPFAGWQSPYMKQYKGDTSICNMNVDLNWRPDPK